MKCQKCGMDAIIASSGYRVTGDGAAETPTKLYRVLSYRCRNPQCASYAREGGEIIGREEIELPVETGQPA